MDLKGKTVLVTGADGFIGSHLTEMLVEKGCKVKALSVYNSFNYWGWLENINCLKEVEVLNGDVRDPHYCKHITKGVDVVFHLAGDTNLWQRNNPQQHLVTVTATQHVVDSALNKGLAKFIHTRSISASGFHKEVLTEAL